MRTMTLGCFTALSRGALIAGGIALSLGAVAWAAPPGGGVARGAMPSLDAGVQLVQSGSRCDQLRRACLYKHELGEKGEGNCKRYRSECSGGGDNSDKREYREYRPSLWWRGKTRLESDRDD